MANFWNTTTIDPKRSFRFVMTFGGVLEGQLHSYIVKMAKQPSFTVSNVAHQYIAHSFNFPGRLTWEPLEVTFVDPCSPDASNALVNVISKSGYNLPTTEHNSEISFSRSKAVAALGQPTITQLDGNGNPTSMWTLINPWIERVDFGQLDYSSEEMVNITTSIRYDYATYAFQAIPNLPVSLAPVPTQLTPSAFSG